MGARGTFRISSLCDVMGTWEAKQAEWEKSAVCGSKYVVFKCLWAMQVEWLM
jgi:hypothetical protein